MKQIKNLSLRRGAKSIRNIWSGFLNLSFTNSIHEWLVISSCFSVFLLFIRVIVTGSTTFIFLTWNLFLAFIPYWITWILGRKESIVRNKLKLFSLLGGWLLFIPNSFYIVTDLFHLTHVSTVPQWFDVLMIFSFAWNGILCGIISIRRIEIVVAPIIKRSFSFFILFAVMWLCALGVYVGRFLRFNSWDIFTNPFSLFGDILDLIIHPFRNFYPWAMTFCYAIFMTLLYYSIKKLNESLNTENFKE